MQMFPWYVKSGTFGIFLPAQGNLLKTEVCISISLCNWDELKHEIDT